MHLRVAGKPQFSTGLPQRMVHRLEEGFGTGKRKFVFLIGYTTVQRVQ